MRAERAVHPRQRVRIDAIEPSPYDRRAQVVRWFSPSLGVAKRLHIYLPPGYDESAARYPVLFLLRGHEREWLNVDEDSSRQGQNLLDVYEQLFLTGAVGPMILVMPSLTSDDGIVHGIGVDNLAPWLAGHARGVGTGQWERYLVNDVISLVDAHWRTRPGGAHRGLDGFSLGGAVAAKLGAKHPGLFRSVGAYDGTFFYSDDDGSAVQTADRLLSGAIFQPAFGRELDLRHIAANSPANLILRADPAQLRRTTWMIQYGPKEIEPWGSNFYRGEHLVAALERRGIANDVTETVLWDGDHTWRTAHRHMAATLPIHWRVLSAELPIESVPTVFTGRSATAAPDRGRSA